MAKSLFYLKESLVNPTSFFEHQNENPEIIHFHWIIIPTIIFIVTSFIHWISTTIILNEMELDFFDRLFIIHLDHPIFGISLTLFLWFRAWIPLRYVGKIDKRTSEINAWCITPYLVVFIVLFCFFSIYFSIFGNADNFPVRSGPSITSIQHGTGIFRLALFVADVWSLFVMYNAVSVINRIQIKKFLLGAIIIFFLPSIVSGTTPLRF